MLIDTMLIFLLLAASAASAGVMLWILLNREVSIQEALRLTCIAWALNKLFLFGSGYIAMIVKLKHGRMPAHKSLVAFLLLELLCVVPWILLGFYFGARFCLRWPFFFLLIAAAVCLLWYQAKKNKKLLLDSWEYVRAIKMSLTAVIPFLLAHLSALLLYYFALMRLCSVKMDWQMVTKIMSMSIAAGYLSPAPAGIGFKEAAMTALFMQQGFTFARALSIAVADRLIVSLAFLAFGLLAGAKLLAAAMGKKGA
jgi:uncharacterized membrane protein YbhN (UPF0104 family)